MLNKEQVLFALSLALLGTGGALAATGWKIAGTFQPPGESRTKPDAVKRQLQVPMFASEMPETAFHQGGRDPFARKTEVRPLPPAELPAPPLPPMTRVLPGPMPMPGFTNLRMLEIPIPAGAVQFTPPAASGGTGETGEDSDDGDWDRRRW